MNKQSKEVYNVKGFWRPTKATSRVKILYRAGDKNSSLVKAVRKTDSLGNTLRRKCLKAIKFEQNINGKWVPVNLDGSAHSDAWTLKLHK